MAVPRGITLLSQFELQPVEFSQNSRNEVNIAKKRRLTPDPSPPSSDKYTANWYLKHYTDAKKALKRAGQEVIAQEIFRLFVPGHPKTRLVISDGERKIPYVVSKEVKNAIPPYAETFANRLLNQELEGLGEILVVSLLVSEMDLRLLNLLIRDDGRIIKIDGDWCFAECTDLFENYNLKINEFDIASLPILYQRQAYNWLNIIELGNRSLLSNDHYEQLSRKHAFRREVNSMLLKIILLPTSYIETLIVVHLGGSKIAHTLLNKIKVSKEQMTESAFKNHDFKVYLKSEDSTADILDFFEHLHDFFILGKRGFDREKLGKDLFAGLRQLRTHEESNVADDDNHILPHSKFVIEETHNEDDREIYSAKIINDETKTDEFGLEKHWWLRPASSRSEAERVMLAQEIYRLFTLEQPQALLVRNQAGHFYSAAKKSFGFFAPNKLIELRDMLLDGHIGGLGELLIVSLFLQDVNLGLDSIGTNAKGRFVKQETNACFASLMEDVDSKALSIRAEDINNLPYLTQGRWVKSWPVSAVEKSEPYALPTFLSGENKKFNQEICLAILKIILLPDTFYYDFLQKNLSDQNEIRSLLHVLLMQKVQLRQAAMQIDAFKYYVLGNAVDSEMVSYIELLKNFKTNGKELDVVRYGVSVGDALSSLYEEALSWSEKETEKNLAAINAAMICDQLDETEISSPAYTPR